MKPFLFIIFLTLVGLVSCTNQKPLNEKARPIETMKKSKLDTIKNLMREEDIIEHVKKAINPKYKNWVLFSNGTYIILEDSTIHNKVDTSIAMMKEYGPVHAGGPAGDFSTIKLTYTDGWVVNGHGYGMYTYVHPKELSGIGINMPSDVDVGLYGRAKREKDGRELKIIFKHE